MISLKYRHAALAGAAFLVLGCGGSSSGGSSGADSGTPADTTDERDVPATDGTDPGDVSQVDGSDVGGGDGGDDAGGTDGDAGPDTGPPVGEAGLTFVPLLGDGYKAPFDAGVKPQIPEDTSTDRGDLLILLCDVADPQCATPIVRRVDKEDPEEWSVDVGGPAPLQSKFGPTITVDDLPAGTYDLMIVYDSLDSQRRGFGWDDAFPTDETAWGGIVSETDLMLSDVEAGPLSNPAPKPVRVTLVDGETEDLDKVLLSHFHERRISEVPAAGQGHILVGDKANNSIRLVDLSTYEMVEAPGGGFQFDLVAGSGQPVAGDLCNVIEGPAGTVFAIFRVAGASNAGYAVQWDPATRTQPHTNQVAFPVGALTNAGPCRAIYHEHAGKQLLYAVAADSDNQGGRVGFWSADVTNLAAGDVTATVFGLADDVFFKEPLDSVAAHEGRVFIGTQTDQLAPCEGEACAFEAAIDPATGIPALVKSGGNYVVHKVGFVKEDVPSPVPGADETISCQDTEQGVAYFSLTVVPYPGGDTDLLVFGGCHELDMMDLATDQLLDFDPAATGVQGLNVALFGGGYYDLALSPDGSVLWGVPANKSRIQHSVESFEPIGEDITGPRITLDRHALVPVDLSAATLPRIDPAYTTTDRDDFEGVPPDGIQDHASPAADPGIDIRALFLKRYYVFWNKSLSGSMPRPFPVGPTLAVAGNTVWVRGTGVDAGDSGQSGIGVGGNLAVADLARQRLVLWPDAGQAFYPPFVGLKQQTLGFDVTPGSDIVISTAGLIYIAP